MKRLVSTADMAYEEWLKYRKIGIGGSDAGAICGLNPYRNAMAVYYDKTTDETEPIDNEAMREGRDLEQYVAERFSEVTGLKVRRSRAIYQHDKFPFMIANVDRLIVGQNVGLECKTATPYQLDKWENNQIPAHYLIQCHHYMAVTGASAWWIAVLIYGRAFIYRKIDRDESIIENLIQIESDFWNNHVEKRVMPSADGSEICESIIKAYYPEADKTKITLPEEYNNMLNRRNEIIDLGKKLDAERSQIEQEIKLYMKNSEVAANNRFIVQWSNISSQRIDMNRLKTEKPSIYQDYLNTMKTRRFMIKPIREVL